MRYISQLPEPYKSLAEKRRDSEKKVDSDKLSVAFHWQSEFGDTLFWNKVYLAETEQELPPIPEAE